MAEDGNFENHLQNDMLNRTSFHFQPQRNWLNDPNAPLYYKGFYHLFYQHNPLAPKFSRTIVWGHSVSQDMVNWIQLEPALIPSEPYDSLGCWSGSATILPNGKPVILYTGRGEPDKTQVTILAEPKDASDPLLREWVKSKYNPVMVSPDDVPHNCFRDPTTAWQGKGEDKKWRVLIGAKHKDTERGMALLYRCDNDDFVQWTKFHVPLLELQVTEMLECVDFFPVSTTGKEGVENSVNNDNVRHVLKVSFEEKIGGKDSYVIGTYSSETEEFFPDSKFSYTSDDLRYDHGMFYASKAFFDSAKKRRINWGWILETDSEEDQTKKGWAGLMSLPREIWLDTSGKRLIQWPIQEINNLRTGHVAFDTRHIESGSNFEVSGITAAQADVEVIFDLPTLEDNPHTFDSKQVDDDKVFGRENLDGCVYGPFGLLALASSDLSEQTAIFFKIIRRGNGYSVIMGSDQKRLSLRDIKNKSTHGTVLDDIDPRDERRSKLRDVNIFTHGTVLDIDPKQGKISLRCLIDHSIIESFVEGGKNVITSRVYPKLGIGEAAKLYVFNDGTRSVTMSSLDAWSMRNAQINTNEI